MPRSPAPQQPSAPTYPGWFTDFLADRAVRKPSPHTAKQPRLFWTDASADLEALKAFLVEEYPKIMVSEPAYPRFVQQNPTPPYSRNVGPYAVFDL